MNFEVDPNLTAMALIHSIISDGEDVARRIEAVIAAEPEGAIYCFPKENVHKIINALKLNAELSKKLLEQHQETQEMIRGLMKKYMPEDIE